MLTSLIAVLLLLVIGFYAVFIGAVGRAGSGEAPLSAPRRLGMMVIGLAALGVAYLVYSHPSSLQSSARAPKSWSATTPSNPPETRGDAQRRGLPRPPVVAHPVREDPLQPRGKTHNRKDTRGASACLPALRGDGSAIA